MPNIPGTLYILGDDGLPRLDPHARSAPSEVEPSVSFKRSRAPSTLSSCTLVNSPSSSLSPVSTPMTSPDDSDLEVEIIEVRSCKPSAPKKRIRSHELVPALLSDVEGLGPTPVTDQVPRQRRYDPARPQSRVPDSEIIDIDLIDDESPGGANNMDDFEDRLERQYFRRPEAQGPQSSRDRRLNVLRPPQRNAAVVLPFVEIEKHKLRNMELKPGKTIEFLDGSFLKVAKVILNVETDEVTLRGWLLKRCKDLNGLVPKKLNELCYMLEVDHDDHRGVWEQSMVEKGLYGLIRIRQLICTNFPMPQLGFSRLHLQFDTKEENMAYVRDFERVVVRWKFVTFYDNALDRSKKWEKVYPFHVRKRCLERLAEPECTPGCFMRLAELRKAWQGDTVVLRGADPQVSQPKARPAPRGAHHHNYECHECGDGFDTAEDLFSHFQRLHESKVQEKPKPRASRQRRHSIIEILDEDEDEKSNVSREEIEDIRVRLRSVLSTDGGANAPAASRTEHGRSSYTYGDAFCGAGGTTSGAVAAGLRVIWGLDLDKNAGQTWRHNFPQATHYELWVHELMALREADGFRVDILHMSPPCQVFSPMHARPGNNDQQNFDSLFACDAIVNKARPRIITLEQTFGILHPKFQAAFHSLVQIFTSYGYAVSWQLVQFQYYGLAQTRRRLIIFAACPGETLPQVPAYTHSEDGSRSSRSSSRSDGPLQPLNTVAAVLQSIPRGAPNHDVHAVRDMGKGRWDARTTISTLCCDGGTKGYPDGSRGLTLRELAALQSFPHDHAFRGAYVKKQIGNAVPPLVARVLFMAVVSHLEERDRAEGIRGGLAVGY
ncbi:uncharacterized protein L3040_002581 [Drepanopeziza brunnea f. sp. 'multigermtubi']|uniref:uncharacterized protein n=1 Tax=Drepanopeziza brunnea f. sp. 'multigermtubi' TaxID=698441 RepID=UPI00239B3AA6|nr:hypothetical protein L3040_002581 [Drepanopeziza brunnea f. sp. 'multigermtubi']